MKRMKIRLIWDDCRPTIDRRPITCEDIENDIHLQEFESEDDLIKHLCNLSRCNEDDLEKFTKMLLIETSTFGVRYNKLQRKMLDRKFEKISTKYGDIQIKLGYLNGKLIKVTPEYEHCKIIANRENIPLIKVFQEINYLISEKFFKNY